MQFEARHSRNRLVAAIVISVLLLGFGALSIFDPSWTENSKLVKAGMDPQTAAMIFGILFLGGGAFFGYTCYQRIVHVGPVVRIDANGILWSQWSAKPIEWSNIDRILLGTETNTPYLKLYFKNPEIDMPDNDKMTVRANADRVSQRAHLYLSFFGLNADRKLLRDVVHWYLEQRFEKDTLS
jgi:hypothetical protein